MHNAGPTTTMLFADKYGSAASLDSRAVREDQKRLALGEPLDYIIGWAPFLGIRIDLSLKPFIPRPETEYWAKRAIGSLQKRGGGAIEVLDMFAGSGCIGLAVLQYVPGSHTTFVDTDSKFLQQIEISAAHNGISQERFTCVQSDMFEAVSGSFDVILANPPYVGQHDELDESVKTYEPFMAYDGGDDGLVVIRSFLASAHDYLNPDGEIWMEFGSSQAPAIKKILKRRGFENAEIHHDQYARDRYLVIHPAPQALQPR